MQPHDWRASWIAARLEEPAPPPAVAIDRTPRLAHGKALPIFRRQFDLDKPVRKAIVSICGLGQYVLSINGRPVTRSLLNPGWTDYRKTVLYDTYDVTRLLLRGKNALGVMLGNGMYNVEGVKGRYTKFVGSFGQSKLIMQLRLLFEDGSERWVVSDDDWMTMEGPITFSSIYGGEDFDVRIEQPGWDTPGFRPGPAWKPVHRVNGPGGLLKAQSIPSVGVARLFEPVAITEPSPGIFVYDFGSNFSGRPRLRVRGGSAGQVLHLTPGEELDVRGRVTQRSFAARPGDAVYFSYTLGNREHYELWPRFDYEGFRYLEVHGAAPPSRAVGDMPVLETLVAEFVHAALPDAGWFDCSDTRMVDIHHLIKRAVLSNTFSVLTDCPQREKLGWLEQTYLNATTVFYNFDAVALYEKMIGDIKDAQQPDGMVPAIAPEYVRFITAQGRDTAFRDSPNWGSAVVLSPWAAYRQYGDHRILETGYDAMRRYADYLTSRAQDHLVDYGLGDWYDIGPKPPGVAQLTDVELTGTAVYYEVLAVLARIAQVLARPEHETASYRDLAGKVLQAFNARFFNTRTATYGRGSQTAQAMPLALGMVPKDHVQGVLERLVDAIRIRENGVSAGDIGFHYVVRALTDHDRGDVMFDMMSVTQRPSYGYQLARGMTSLTEAWDANPDKSLNHFMLGSGEQWLFRGLGGIQIDFSRAPEAPPIRIAPQVVNGITHVRVRHQSVLGMIESSWERQDARLTMKVSVPAGAHAAVSIPTIHAEAIREGRHRLEQVRGIEGIQADGRRIALRIGSGRYRFHAPFERDR